MTTPPPISSNDPSWIRHQGLVKSHNRMGVPSCEVHSVDGSASSAPIRRRGLVRRGGKEAFVHPRQPGCAFLRNPVIA